MKAIIYMRVSTEEQAEKGFSLRFQQERLQRYCNLKNIEVIKHFTDDYSAKTFDRPAFNKLLKYCKKNRKDVDFILFQKWDRFSRNTEEAYKMIRIFADLGITVDAIEQPVDTSIPENKLMLAFFLAVPEVENERRSINVKQGMRRALKEGRWMASAPKGYSNCSDSSGNKFIQPNKDAKFVKWAFAQVAKGIYPIEEVRRQLRKKGFKVSRNYFNVMMKRYVYIGKIQVPAWKNEDASIVEGQHEGIIDEKTFYKVQAVFSNSKQLGLSRKTQRSEFPLRGHLRCGICDSKLTASISKGNGGAFAYYHCTKGCKERFRADNANQSFVKHLSSLAINPEVVAAYKGVAKQIFDEQLKDRAAESEQINKKLSELNQKLLKTDESYVEGNIELDSYNRLKKSYHQKISELENIAKKDTNENSNLNKYFKTGLSLLQSLDTHYEDAPLHLKHLILSSMFPQKIIYKNKRFRTTGQNAVLDLNSK